MQIKKQGSERRSLVVFFVESNEKIRTFHALKTQCRKMKFVLPAERGDADE